MFKITWKPLRPTTSAQITSITMYPLTNTFKITSWMTIEKSKYEEDNLMSCRGKGWMCTEQMIVGTWITHATPKSWIRPPIAIIMDSSKITL